MPVNLKETTATTIAFLQAEFAKSGVEVSCTLQTGSGLKKQFRENNVSGLDIFHACNFALTKVVAAIVNDEEVRRFIDPQLER